MAPSNPRESEGDLDEDEGEGEGEGEGDHEDVEIDEISDGEDDRRAHELLQAVPVRIGTTRGSSPILLPYDNHDFVVRTTHCQCGNHRLTYFIGARFKPVGP